MKLLLIADNGTISDPLQKLLLTHEHDMWVVTPDESKKEQLQHSGVHVIVGNPAENGSWINSLPEKIDTIVNVYNPFTSSKLSHTQLENIYNPILVKIAQNISYIASKTNTGHIYQLIPPNYYGHAPIGTINEKVTSNLNSYAFAYDGMIRHLRALKNIKTTLLITASFIYTSQGETFPNLPTVFNKIHPILNHGDNWISLIHLEDLCAATMHILENNSDHPVINIVDDKPLMQKDFVTIISKIHQMPHPLPIPEAFANMFYGEAIATTMTSSAKIKNDLLKSTNYWLKYPDFQAGLAKFLVAM